MGDTRLPQDLASIVARRLAERRGEFAVIGMARSGASVARMLRAAAGLSVYVSDASDSAEVRATGADWNERALWCRWADTISRASRTHRWW